MTEQIIITAPTRQPEWPAEPWVVGVDEEIGCVFQEGEVEVILVVDPDRENPDLYVADTARRVADCVNALAGIEDPATFVAAAKRYVLACIASDDGRDLSSGDRSAATELGERHQAQAWDDLVAALGATDLSDDQAATALRALLGEAP